MDLLLPFKHGTKMIRSVTLGPMTWDHSLKWQAGEFFSSVSLLFSLSDRPEEVLRQLRYPDVDRVMENFLAILPPGIREQIANGEVPQKFIPPQVDDLEPPLSEEHVEAAALDDPEDPGHDPYRMPTREEIEQDMLAHPVPPGGFEQKPPPKDTGLGFDIDG